MQPNHVLGLSRLPAARPRLHQVGVPGARRQGIGKDGYREQAPDVLTGDKTCGTSRGY